MVEIMRTAGSVSSSAEMTDAQAFNYIGDDLDAICDMCGPGDPEECDTCETLPAYTKAKAALWRQIPVGSSGNRCPSCGGEIGDRFRFCPWCGQAVYEVKKVTNTDAIEFFSGIREKHRNLMDICVTDAARQIHVDSIDMYDLAIDALEKQVPQKPILEDGYYICPCCGCVTGSVCCEYCGQLIDWE